jgi:2-C-methyl-D-erythritol 2,4-cyclodiphosphate synthase
MTRIGMGFDSHRFAGPGPLRLGGVEIDHPQGLSAHSDGDVLLHALTDAILGALAAGDIGEHFPDSDPQYRDMPSKAFLEKALSIAHLDGYTVGNCDVTVLAEAPKLGPHKARIASHTAELLGIDVARVSIKAKTGEGMGFIGAGEGIAAWAVVLLNSTARSGDAS